VKLERDLVFYDLEATGTDPLRDRIVQIALVRLKVDGARERFDSLVNPERPIPPAAIAIHHITDEMAAQAPTLRVLAPKIRELFDGADLGGFNIRGYDLPMLQAELARVAKPLDMEGRRVVDAMTIFHKLEPRTLGRAYEFYCGKLLEKAHDATADAEASLDVFLAQVERYHGRPGRPDLAQDIAGLHDFCDLNVDALGKLNWREGEAAFSFGKYRGKTLREVLELEPGYIQWLSRNRDFSAEVADICAKALNGVFPKRK
jgi:DNA polymerase-3 subunit epsilon